MAHIDVFGGLITGSGNSASGSGGVIGSTARANIPLWGWWNLQLDVDGIGSSASNTTNLNHTDLSGYAHLYARMPGWNLGGYVGVTRQSSGEPRWLNQIGVEVGVPVNNQMYVGANAALGFVSQGSASGTMVQVGVNGRYDLTRNHTLRGDLMYTNFSGMPGASYSVVTAAVTGQYRFDNSPWGVFAMGRLDSYSGDASGSTFQALVGGTLYFDPPGSSLEDQNERGPNWTLLRVAYHL